MKRRPFERKPYYMMGAGPATKRIEESVNKGKDYSEEFEKVLQRGPDYRESIQDTVRYVKEELKWDGQKIEWFLDYYMYWGITEGWIYEELGM